MGKMKSEESAYVLGPGDSHGSKMAAVVLSSDRSHPRPKLPSLWLLALFRALVLAFAKYANCC